MAKVTMDMSDKKLQNIGRQMFKGAWDWLIWQLLLTLLILGVFWYFTGRFDYDDTDGHSKRSGMVLLTDYGTGCQYLRVRGGGVTPRMNANGRHICGPNHRNAKSPLTEGS